MACVRFDIARANSHDQRFAVKGASESADEFRKGKNEQALDDEEIKPESPEDHGWFLGARIRERGSVHSDVWNSSAADLAEREVIAVYAVSEWWKDQPKRDRSVLGVRYALIVSIETLAEDIDIWTPVATEVGIAIEAEPIAIPL